MGHWASRQAPCLHSATRAISDKPWVFMAPTTAGPSPSPWTWHAWPSVTRHPLPLWPHFLARSSRTHLLVIFSCFSAPSRALSLCPRFPFGLELGTKTVLILATLTRPRLLFGLLGRTGGARWSPGAEKGNEWTDRTQATWTTPCGPRGEVEGHGIGVLEAERRAGHSPGWAWTSYRAELMFSLKWNVENDTCPVLWCTKRSGKREFCKR